jgi:hypothetical protein
VEAARVNTLLNSAAPQRVAQIAPSSSPIRGAAIGLAAAALVSSLAAIALVRQPAGSRSSAAPLVRRVIARPLERVGPEARPAALRAGPAGGLAQASIALAAPAAEPAADQRMGALQLTATAPESVPRSTERARSTVKPLWPLRAAVDRGVY